MDEYETTGKLNGVDLEQFKISKGPRTIYYIPEFITEAQEKLLVEQVNSAPKPKWTQLSNRRLQNYGGIPHPKGMIAEEIPNWLAIHMKSIENLHVFDGKSPNHVLVNEYTPGQGIMPHLDGPLFHPVISTINLGSHSVLNFYHPIKQDEAEIVAPHNGFTELVNNQDGLIETKPQLPNDGWKNRLAFSLLVQPRSLLILKDDTYHHYLHGIDEISSDVISDNCLNLDKCEDVASGSTLIRTARISLTIRHVPKTTKPILRFRRC